MKKVKVLFLAMLVFACVCFASGCGEKVYKINFMVDGQVYHTVQSPGKDIVELPSNPTKDNFVFLGWYEDKEQISKEITEIKEAFISGTSSYELKYNVEVEKKFMGMKLKMKK